MILFGWATLIYVVLVVWAGGQGWSCHIVQASFFLPFSVLKISTPQLLGADDLVPLVIYVIVMCGILYMLDFSGFDGVTEEHAFE